MSRRLLIARPGHIYLATYSSSSASTIPHIKIDLDLPFAGNPSWIAIHPTDRSLLYAVDESGSSLHLFELNLKSSKLTQIAQRDNASKGVCHLEFNKQGTLLLGSAYAEGAIDIWNTEDPREPQLVMTLPSKDPVVDAGRVPHAHQAVVDPTGRFFVVNDLGTDSMLVLDALRPHVPVVRRVTVESGSGPRHGVFYPGAAEGEVEKAATHYFLLCETSNRVEVFELKYREGDIEFTPAGSYSTFVMSDGDGEEGVPKRGAFAAAGEIVLSKDSRHLYTSNRLTTDPTETIAHFRIITADEDDGDGDKEGGGLKLELVGETSTRGKHPRMFSLSRDGSELFVGNQEGEWALVVLRRREEDGTLEEEPVAGILMEDLVAKGSDEKGPMFVLEVE
ncbi:putative isomerase YbhE [Trichoderma citrinoviride]|uniref:Putative isomerase YbhE n=1 Tax=Trichoderma citrinoviride TaxID=58853 RepID=A0A2T4B6V4_9HYPO|nr:putative isomerase YbhE [Trichoderma citrinoviride]PTB65055.1 putative isomerase YbhE [Trichoderma citrinoviride]